MKLTKHIENEILENNEVYHRTIFPKNADEVAIHWRAYGVLVGLDVALGNDLLAKFLLEKDQRPPAYFLHE